MRLALECPTSMLKAIQPLADFDWALAHLVLEDEEYAEYYRKSKRPKVLDNSVNELLVPLSLGDIARAAEIVKPNFIVAPDYLRDLDATWNALTEAIRVFGKGRVIPVLQGTWMDSLVAYFTYLVSQGFEEVAVPYDILSERGDTSELMAERRLAVVREVISKAPFGFSIHLLGFNTLEELEMHNRGWVKSIDTGVPVHLGLKGYRFGYDTLPSKDGPTMNRMSGITSLDPDYSMGIAYYNIAYLRRVLGGT